MKYLVRLYERLDRDYEVLAQNEEEAKDKAMNGLGNLIDSWKEVEVTDCKCLDTVVFPGYIGSTEDTPADGVGLW